MKITLNFTLILSILTFISCKQKLVIPATVKNAFEQKFSNTEDVTWNYDSENKLWEVDYKTDSTEFTSIFDENGKWIESEKDIEYSELPETIQEVLNSDYSDYDIEEIEWINKGEDTIYEVDFILVEDEEELELLFSPDGSITPEIE